MFRYATEKSIEENIDKFENFINTHEYSNPIEKEADTAILEKLQYLSKKRGI